MAGFEKDLVIPREMLNEFKVSVRVIDKRKWAGMWPVDARIHKLFEHRFPKLYANTTFRENYDLALVHRGKNLKKDIGKLGLELDQSKVFDRVIINGIPVPWTLLKKMDIDHKKFDVVFTPKM